MSEQLSEVIDNDALPIVGSTATLLVQHPAYHDWIQFDTYGGGVTIDVSRNIQSLRTKEGRTLLPVTNVPTRPVLRADGPGDFPVGKFNSDSELNAADALGLGAAFTLMLFFKALPDTDYRSLLALHGPDPGAKPYLQYNVDFPTHRLIWGNGVAASIASVAPIGAWTVAFLACSATAISSWTPAGGRVTVPFPSGTPAPDWTAQHFSIGGLADQTGAFRGKAEFAEIIIYDGDVTGDADLQELAKDYAQLFGIT